MTSSVIIYQGYTIVFLMYQSSHNSRNLCTILIRGIIVAWDTACMPAINKNTSYYNIQPTAYTSCVTADGQPKTSLEYYCFNIRDILLELEHFKSKDVRFVDITAVAESQLALHKSAVLFKSSV